MGIKELQESLARVEEFDAKQDFENAHSLEDRIIEDFIREVAAGTRHARALAIILVAHLDKRDANPNSYRYMS